MSPRGATVFRVHATTSVGVQSKMLYTARAPLECASCGRTLAVGDAFTAGLAGRPSNPPVCSVCTPWHLSPMEWVGRTLVFHAERLVAGCGECERNNRVAPQVHAESPTLRASEPAWMVVA